MNAALRSAKAHVFVDNLAVPQLHLDDEHHLLKVLRVREADAVSVSDGLGNWLLASLTRSGELVGQTDVVHEPAPPYAIGVAFAPVKGEKPEVIVQKLTELGVARLVPLITTRGVALPTAAACARLERTVIEACKQCGRDRLMVIDEPATVGDALRRQPAGTSLLIADPAGETAAPAATAGPVLVLVGPEGGFTAEEVTAAEAAGCQRVTFGRHILRIETAAIAAAARLA